VCASAACDSCAASDVAEREDGTGRASTELCVILFILNTPFHSIASFVCGFKAILSEWRRIRRALSDERRLGGSRTDSSAAVTLPSLSIPFDISRATSLVCATLRGVCPPPLRLSRGAVLPPRALSIGLAPSLSFSFALPLPSPCAVSPSHHQSIEMGRRSLARATDTAARPLAHLSGRFSCCGCAPR